MHSIVRAQRESAAHSSSVSSYNANYIFSSASMLHNVSTTRRLSTLLFLVLVIAPLPTFLAIVDAEH